MFKKYNLIVCGLAVASAAHADLLVNGNFETFNQSGSFVTAGTHYWRLGNGSDALDGWTVGTRSGDVSIDVVDGIYQHNGSFGVDLAGTSGPGSISQSVATNGGIYRLSFWAMATGDNLNFTLDYSFASVSGTQGLDTTWRHYTIDLTSNAGSSTLMLGTLLTNTTNGNLFIDDISLQAVPEPFTMGLGGAAVLLAARRMKKRATA